LQPNYITSIPVHFKSHLLAWADQWASAVYLDNNDYPSLGLSSWDVLVAVSNRNNGLVCQAGNAFDQLEDLYQKNPQQWLFGYFGYDLKNEVENLYSNHFDGIGWPDMFFFVPEMVIGIRNGQVEIYAANPISILDEIMAVAITPPFIPDHTITLLPRLPKQDYLDAVQAIRQHILEGDIYEMNFCQEFYAENIVIKPVGTFLRLNTLSRAPFATYLKHDGRTLMCSSPERFLRKEGTRLVTQPIKGTRRRSAHLEEDAQIKAELLSSEKDRSENVMIVDLVRNDLAHHCLPGTIKVEELFGIYSFPTVHQMISTVSGQLPEGNNGLKAIRDAFPMGSMTGAPKVMSMELIERYERTRRGLFSGAVGYFDPNGDFDFNVVIRSLQYHTERQYLSCIAGGAIVYDSVPEMEYEECLLKTAAVRKSLEG
jgi:para-aminobenzoate synthetase component 1